MLCGRNELLAVVGNRHAEHEHPKNIEYKYSPKGLSHRTGNILSGIWSLTKSHAHNLSSSIGEARLAETCPPSQESAFRPSENVFCEGSGRVPVREARSCVVRISSYCNDKSSQDEDSHDQNLDTACPKFDFAYIADVQALKFYQNRTIQVSKRPTHVDKDCSYAKDSHPDSHVQIWSPILDDETGCSQICWSLEDVLEEVIPARSKAITS